MPVRESSWTVDDMKRRRVRYSDLRPCYNAFIDTRTPGSEAKENFTIIGPGVSENPEQFVHIAETHGYNIGGARQPPGCVNSQHSHKTAEVFVVHKGAWRFDLGENGDDAQVVLGEGDVISIPTNIFRGFTCVGNEIGFLWAVLGEDDPGRVTWAPNVFEMAQDYGLVLLESGQLIDTRKGQVIPRGQAPMKPTSPDEIAAMKQVSQDEAEKLVWHSEKSNSDASLPLISKNGVFSWPHGFSLERLVLSAGQVTEPEKLDGSKIVFVQEGDAEFRWDDQELRLAKGDTLTVPRGLTHLISGRSRTEIFIVREGDDSL